MKRRTAKKTNMLPLPIIMIGIGVMLVLGVMIWQVVRASTGSGQGAAPENIQRVTLAQSKEAFDAQSAVFLDVRDSETFSNGHIPGAVNIPLGLLENRVSELDPNQWIISYCT